MKLIIFLGMLAYGGAAIQELYLHEGLMDGGRRNSYTFRDYVPDTTKFSLRRVSRMCRSKNSVWIFYTSTNYLGESSFLRTPACEINEIMPRIKSFCFLGNESTEVDAVSLYAETGYRGQEIYIGHSPFGGITTRVASLGRTGTSAWTIFEGVNFQGKTACLPAQNGFDVYSINSIMYSFNMTTVGSLIKGCLTAVTPELRETLQKAAKHL